MEQEGAATKSCKRQAAHLQLIIKITNFTVSCCSRCVQYEMRLLMTWWVKANNSITLLKQHECVWLRC